MSTVEEFTIRERNVLTLPQNIREVSHLDAGTQGKAVAIQKGIVMLITDPLLVDELAAHVTQWLEERSARDPWARLNEALANDLLEKVPSDRFIAPPEPDEVPDIDRIVSQYGDDVSTELTERNRRA